MTAPSPRPYSIWDGPECIHVGSVAAPSDGEALQSVLAAPPPGVPLDPSRHYRVRVGSAVASAAGDEFQATGESSSMPNDAPAEAAKVERERVEAEALESMKRAVDRDALARRLQDLAEAAPYITDAVDAEKYAEALEAATADDRRTWATPYPSPVNPSAGWCPEDPYGRGVHRVDGFGLVYERNAYGDAVRVGMDPCGHCGYKVGAACPTAHLNGNPLPDAEVARELTGHLNGAVRVTGGMVDAARRLGRTRHTVVHLDPSTGPRYAVFPVRGGRGYTSAGGGNGNAQSAGPAYGGSGNFPPPPTTGAVLRWGPDGSPYWAPGP